MIPESVTDPQTCDMLARYRALPAAGRRAFLATMKACATGGAIYPPALRLMRAMGHPAPEATARRFAADMEELRQRRRLLP